MGPTWHKQVTEKETRKPGGSTWLCSSPVLRAGQRPLLGWGVGSATSFQRMVEGGGSVVDRPDGHTCTGDHSQRPPCRSRDGTHPGRDMLRGPSALRSSLRGVLNNAWLLLQTVKVIKDKKVWETVTAQRRWGDMMAACHVGAWPEPWSSRRSLAETEESEQTLTYWFH